MNKLGLGFCKLPLRFCKLPLRFCKLPLGCCKLPLRFCKLDPKLTQLVPLGAIMRLWGDQGGPWVPMGTQKTIYLKSAPF